MLWVMGFTFRGVRPQGPNPAKLPELIAAGRPEPGPARSCGGSYCAGIVAGSGSRMLAMVWTVWRTRVAVELIRVLSASAQPAM